jgi:hypothetical protein
MMIGYVRCRSLTARRRWPHQPTSCGRVPRVKAQPIKYFQYPADSKGQIVRGPLRPFCFTLPPWIS